MSPHESTKTRPELDFQAELDGIINKPLSVEIVDTYADHALDELIELVHRVLSTFEATSTDSFNSNDADERAAFELYGLGDIEAILDHIHTKATELQSLDRFISGLSSSGQVVVPPYHEHAGVVARASLNKTTEFQPSRTVARLKTLLFILNNEFGLDIKDESQVRIVPGDVTPGMLRKNGYYLVDIPSIAKSALVCDEVGNVTYVFNNDRLSNTGLEPDALAGLSKPELGTMLRNDPQLGKRIKYTDSFVPYLISALNDEPGLDESAEFNGQQVEGRYLMPKAAPEEVLSRNGLVVTYGLPRADIDKAIQAIGKEEFGTIDTYIFGSRHVEGFTPRQQELIRNYIATNLSPGTPPPPGYLHEYGISLALGIANHAVNKITKQLEAEGALGPTDKYITKTHLTAHYSPAQQALIIDRLNALGSLSDKAPEGFLHETGISDWLGIGNDTIRRITDELGDVLGETRIYKNSLGNKSTRHFSPEQQALIREAVEAKGLLVDQAPEGVVSRAKLAKELKVAMPTIDLAIAALGEELGEIKRYKIPSPRDTYTVEQQQLIKNYLEENEYLLPIAPEDYVSLTGLRDLLDIGRGRLKKLLELEEVSSQLGEVRRYKFGSRTYFGYSPAQQEILRARVAAEGLTAEPAPEGVLAVHALSKILRHHPDAVYNAVDELGDQLEEVRAYKFGSIIANGFTPAQQSQIAEFIRAKRAKQS